MQATFLRYIGKKEQTFARGFTPNSLHFAMRAKLGDFVFLHCRNFDTWGRISKVPNLAHDPLADIFEIIDHRGRVTWTRSNAIKFLHSSSDEPLSAVKKSLELPASIKEQIKNWAFSLKEEQTFHLSNVVELLGKERWETLGNSFAIFRFLYIYATDWLQKDATFRINGPFTVRTASERLLIEGGERAIDQRGDKQGLIDPNTKLLNAQRPLDQCLRKFAYCSFENTINSPYSSRIKQLRGKTQAEAHEMLLQRGTVPTLLNIPLEQCTLQLEVPNCPQILHQLPILPGERVHYDQVIAIDGERASEIDDALSISMPGPRFHIHIADCTAYIPFDSPLDLIARQRATSVYLPERTFPMLPWAATKQLSLTANKHCITFSFDLVEGKIVNPSIAPSTIGRLVRKTYEQVEEQLANESCPTLAHLWSAAKALSANSVNRIRIQLPQPQIWVSKAACGTKNEYQFNQNPCPNAHMLVAELMIAAGRVASEYCAQQGIPIPFRSQGTNELWSAEILSAFKQAQPSLLDSFLYSKTAFAARFTPVPQDHVSMGLSCYAKVTSPIRRVADQLVHHHLKAHWDGKRLPLNDRTLIPILDWINERESRTKLLQRQSLRYWTLVYWKEKVKKANIFAGTVVGYLELYRTFQIFVHQWNVIIPYRLDYGPSGGVLGLEIGMDVKFVVLENEPASLNAMEKCF